MITKSDQAWIQDEMRKAIKTRFEEILEEETKLTQERVKSRLEKEMVHVLRQVQELVVFSCPNPPGGRTMTLSIVLPT